MKMPVVVVLTLLAAGAVLVLVLLALPTHADVVYPVPPSAGWGGVGGGVFQSPLLAPDSSASAPSYSWSNNSNTGFFSAAAGAIGVAAGGTERVRLVAGGIRMSTNALGFGTVFTGSEFTLARGGTHVLAQTGGTSAQTYHLYNTFTDASNYERLSIGWASNVMTIATAGAGTGTNLRPLKLGTNNFSVTGTAPTISSCGTSPSTVTGSPAAGRFTWGTGDADASCTLTFPVAFTVAPICMANNETTITTVRAVASTTALELDAALATSVGGDVVTYICLGGS